MNTVVRFRTLPLLALLAAVPLGLRADGLERIRISDDGPFFELAESGRLFQPRGFNYDHDMAGRLIEDYWTEEWGTVEQDFREMRELGANVVRIHLQFGAFMDSPERPNRESLGRLSKLLALAESTGLYLDLTGLGCYHKSDVPQWYDRLSDEQRWKAQAVFWRAVASCCSNSPAVFCYDLMNEPVVPGNQRRSDWLGPAFGDKHFVQFIARSANQRLRHEIARDWIRMMVRAIRREDPTRLITVGLVPWSVPRPGKLTSGFAPARIAEELDFLSLHIYPKKGELGEAASIVQEFAAIGKPLVIEESFPLKCDTDEMIAFVEDVWPDVQGWISFYWGKTLKEYEAGSTIGDAVMSQWLTGFRDRVLREPPAPYVLVLGTAQDAGLPQLACDCANCRAARRDARLTRRVASLLLVDPRPIASRTSDGVKAASTGARTWLFDASPDLRKQHAMALKVTGATVAANGRPPLFSALFLTHAHTGHYLGLAHFGPPAYNSRGQLVYASRRMCDFLTGNGPWSLLVESGNLVLRPVEPDRRLELASGVSVTPIRVPHRAEFTDTYGYVISGPSRKLLYIPDIDKWERWDAAIEEWIGRVDYALLDGTFFADGEVPGRKMSEIPHPFVVETMERLAKLPAGERRKVWLIHLNHTNPLNDPESAASRQVRRAGMHVARDGIRFRLSR